MRAFLIIPHFLIVNNLSYYDKKLLTFYKYGGIIISKGAIIMSNLRITETLRIIILLMGLLGAGAYAIVLSWGLDTFVRKYPEFAYFYTPWMIFLLLTAIPLYAILVFGWRIAGEIGKDNSFSEKNAKNLKYCAFCLGGDAVFFLLGNVAFLFLNLNHPGVVCIACVFCSFVFMIACAVYLLAHLVQKASAIREENEAFI